MGTARRLAIWAAFLVITGPALAQQNRTVTCSGVLVDFQTNPLAAFPTAVIYDAQGGYACLIDRGQAGHDPLRPCTAGQGCLLVGTYKSKIGQTYIIDRLVSVDILPQPTK
jgi:hypothetical protein